MPLVQLIASELRWRRSMDGPGYLDLLTLSFVHSRGIAVHCVWMPCMTPHVFAHVTLNPTLPQLCKTTCCQFINRKPCVVGLPQLENTNGRSAWSDQDRTHQQMIHTCGVPYVIGWVCEYAGVKTLMEAITAPHACMLPRIHCPEWPPIENDTFRMSNVLWKQNWALSLQCFQLQRLWRCPEAIIRAIWGSQEDKIRKFYIPSPDKLCVQMHDKNVLTIYPSTCFLS